MPKQTYVEHKFAARTMALLNKANEIIEEYAGQGFDLTLRQLFYQLVSRSRSTNAWVTSSRMREGLV